MRNTNTLLATLLASTSTVLSQLLANCDGNQGPEWDDCDAIYSVPRNSVEPIPNFSPDCYVYPAPDGVDPKTLNCRIQWCPLTPEVSETFSGIDGFYRIINSQCSPSNAGGGSGTDAWTLQIFNNPDFEINPSKSKREPVPEPWTGGPPSRKRQQDDDGFTLLVSSRSVEREGIQITGRLPANSMYMVTQEDSKSTSVSVSADVGASFFEFFSASIGTEVTEEQTTSNSVGISVNIPCNVGQSGQVFWYPLYDVYAGFTTPSNTDVEVAVPQNNDVSATNYRVVCLE